MGSADDWSYTTGEKGRNRVRAYERSSGIIYLEFYERDAETGERKRRRLSTRHRDRERAKRQADELAAKFARSAPDGSTQPTLRELFDSYLEYRSPQVSERRQRFHRRINEPFCRYFGTKTEAATLNRSDWDRFVQDRASGAIDQRGRDVAEPDRSTVKPNTVRRDLQGLRAVLNWAVQADLLDANPTTGYPLPTEKNPRRPRLTEERYQAMLAVAGEGIGGSSWRWCWQTRRVTGYGRSVVSSGRTSISVRSWSGGGAARTSRGTST